MEGRVLGKGLGFKYRALISSIHASIKETPLTLPRMEKIAIYEQEKGPSPNLESAGTLIVDLPASRIVRNKHCFFKPPGLHLGITGLVPKAQS